MNRIDLLKRAVKNIKKSKRRTILTAMSISVGAFTIATALAAGSGANEYIYDTAEKVSAINEIEVFKMYEHNAEVEYAEEENSKEEDSKEEYSLSKEDVEKVKKLEGVKKVSVDFWASAKSVTSEAKSDGKKPTFDIRTSINPDKLKLVAGKIKNNNLEKEEAILPEKYCEPLGFEKAEDAIGKMITLEIEVHSDVTDKKEEIPTFQVKLKIVAVSKSEKDAVLGDMSTLKIGDDSIPLFEQQKNKSAIEPIHSITVLTEKTDENSVQSLKKKILNTLENVDAMTFYDMSETMKNAILVAQCGLIGFGMLALLASVFGIINTQYISVLERTRQIGIMKSLGMSRKDIASLFRYEAASIGFLGSVLGIFTAGLLSLFNPLIADMMNLPDGFSLLQLKIVPNLILTLGLMTVAVLAGYFPARKAAKLDPVKALKTE